MMVDRMDLTPDNGRFGVRTHANGLLYMRARYYNPYISRFLNPDPSAFVGGLNFYAFANGNPISETDPFGLGGWASVLGGVRVVGGIFEAAAGITLGAATSWTGIGAVAGGLVAIHGADQIQAGIQQLWTGNQASSLTSQGLQAAGLSPNAANLTDAGLSVVGSLGTGFATTAIRSTTLTSTSISADVVNASLITKVGYYEVGQLSLSEDAYTYYSLWGNTLDRGAAMVADQGGGLFGWAKAMSQGSVTLGAQEGTLFDSLASAWPTPLGAGGVGAIGGVANGLTPNGK
jgi:RHS repeat-associated protein